MDKSKLITVFFSRAGENYCNGSICNLEKGNTKIAAEYIQQTVGGNLFEIKSARDYPEAYDVCTAVAKEELYNKERVPVHSYGVNLQEYQVIFLGYPNWWGTMLMVLFTFLEHYELTGKVLIPFCTNEGSGMGRSISDLKSLCPGAVIDKGLSIHGSDVSDLKDKITSWAAAMTDLYK